MKRNGSVKKAVAGLGRCGPISAAKAKASSAHLQLTFIKISCRRFRSFFQLLLASERPAYLY